MTNRYKKDTFINFCLTNRLAFRLKETVIGCTFKLEIFNFIDTNLVMQCKKKNQLRLLKPISFLVPIDMLETIFIYGREVSRSSHKVSGLTS